MPKTTITEADAERKADKIVQQRLSRSNDYRNAANADEQQEIEDEISTVVWREIEHEYEIW